MAKKIRNMKKKRYRSILEELELSQQAAADFLGVDERTCRRWALGEMPPPRAVALLLELMVSQGIRPPQALELIN